MQSTHFEIQEFVPPAIYSMFGMRSWWYISPKVVAIADRLRDLVGQPVIINNWHRGGQFRFRGYRPPNCTVGKGYSMHRIGLAIDVSVPGMTPAQILQLIQQEKRTFLDLGLTTVEDIRHTPTWLHLDCRPRLAGLQPDNDFLIVQP